MAASTERPSGLETVEAKKKTPDLRGYRKSVAMNRVPAHVGLIRVVTCIVGTALYC